MISPSAEFRLHRSRRRIAAMSPKVCDALLLLTRQAALRARAAQGEQLGLADALDADDVFAGAAWRLTEMLLDRGCEWEAANTVSAEFFDDLQPREDS